MQTLKIAVLNRIMSGILFACIMLFVSCREKPEPPKSLEDRFFEAILNEDINYMTQCMEEGIDINKPYKIFGNYTPLISSLFDKKYRAAKFLVENGADPGIIIELDTLEIEQAGLIFGTKRIQALVYSNFYPDVTQLLITHGANVNDMVEDNASILMNYIQDMYYFKKHGDSEKELDPILQSIKVLLDNGADPDFEGASGINPMLTALNYELREVVDLLLEYNAVLSNRLRFIDFGIDRFGLREIDENYGKMWQNEFFVMASCGYDDLIMRFIENKMIDLEIRDPDGLDIYYYTVVNGNIPLMSKLLPYIKNKETRRYNTFMRKNMSLVDAATRPSFDFEMIQLLEEHGIKSAGEYPGE